MTAFEEMGIHPEIARGLEELEWDLPTDIQAEAIPLILGGGDVLLAAETGAGKTGAFSLPVVQVVWETLKEPTDSRGDGKPKSQNLQMSVHDRSKFLAVSPDGLTVQSRDPKGWHGGRATKGVGGSGKYYFEAKVTDEGLCRIGWSTQVGKYELGLDDQGFGFGGTGKKSFRGAFEDYGEAFGLHDVIGCYLNFDDGTIQWSKNGCEFGTAFQLTGRMRNENFFPAVCLKNAELALNFGQTAFKFPPKGGYEKFASAKTLTENEINGLGSSATSEKESHAPLAIILEPSRELAEQTLKCLENFAKYLNDPPVRCLCMTGGTQAQQQLQALKKGVEIVVATPGRIHDMINQRHLSLRQCRFFILDEADGLVAQGNKNLIQTIYRGIPQKLNGKRFQMIVCSATLHSAEARELERMMHFPTWIDLKGEDAVPDTVHHVVCKVDPTRDECWRTLSSKIPTDGVHRLDKNSGREQLSEAVKLLKGEYCMRVIVKHKMDQGIIFCRTKVDCDNLESFFAKHGGGPSAKADQQFSCVCLHADRSPEDRKRGLEAFKKKEKRFLICTDVAARGIDITGVPFVINMTLPDMKANYLHRIGRVGRAQRMGLAISLVSTLPEKVWYHSNCKNRGAGCSNTDLTDRGGCCIWYDEMALLADIEDHLKETISILDSSFTVEANEFDGKVVYGERRSKKSKFHFPNHVAQIAHAVDEITGLEKWSQLSYLSMIHKVK